MAKRVSIKHKRREAPVWVFSWQRLGESPFSRWFATLLVAAGFTLLLTSVRIRVFPPVSLAASKASVIHVLNDAEGRALTLRAREGGPFPSRFELSDWEGAADLERAAFEAARWSPPPYAPVLRDLPEEVVPRLRLSTKGGAVLPERRSPRGAGPAGAKATLAPVLYPLSGISAAEMPRDLPRFDGAVDATVTAEPWRFLVRLDSGGNVKECVSLAGGDEAGPSPLEVWLQRVSFNPAPAVPSRWIAVGVGFTNQSSDGTDAR